MRTTSGMRIGWRIALRAAVVLAWLAPACLRAAQTEEAPPLFATPELALAALQDAVNARAEDPEAMKKLFGSALNEIANPDPVQRENNMKAFAARMAEGATLTKKDDQTRVVCLGKESWPFPIPVTKKDDKWFFNVEAGKEEILNRRIGQNELSAIELCRAYVQAQREYALNDRGGEGVMEYAQKIRSTPDKKDGLYWETQPGGEPSPFGPLIAKAHEEGYGKRDQNAEAPKTRQPFHGYFIKILTKQGKNAPGGKYDYIINGHMVAGFAFLAYPAEWANSGVMTFIVNQQGKVYQKNWGEKTAELAPEIKEYDPDTTWTAVQE